MNHRLPSDQWDQDPESARQRGDSIADQTRRQQNRQTTFHQPSRLHGRLRPAQQRRRWLRRLVLVGMAIAIVSGVLFLPTP